MNSNRKVLKGFTLVELVVVMAVFGILMAGAIAMLQPVSKQYASTAQFESARGSIDNIRYYLESNLRYADRLWVYKNYKNSTTYDQMVSDFADEYYLVPKTGVTITGNDGVAYTADIDRTAVDTSLNSNYYIYIMTIHNDADCTISGSIEPKGRISLDVYKPDGTYMPDLSKEYAVSESYYTKNIFQVNLGEAQRDSDGVWIKDPTTGAQTYGAFSPGNFATTISIFKKELDKTTSTYNWVDTNLKSVASFAMMNLTNADNIVYKLTNVKDVTTNAAYALQYDDFKQVNYGYNYNINAQTTDNWNFKSGAAITAGRYKEISCGDTLLDGTTPAEDIVFVYTKPKNLG